METWLKGQQHPNFQRLREMISADLTLPMQSIVGRLMLGKHGPALRARLRFMAMVEARQKGEFLQ